jgi:GNAT superfamily N-acetyltransferase
MVAWTDTEKTAFVDMPFRAQAQYYRDHYPDTSYDVIMLDGQQVGRLPLAGRDPHVDIALLPDSCNHGIGTALLRQLQAEAQASGKPLRICSGLP